jgi:hypothetical protein
MTELLGIAIIVATAAISIALIFTLALWFASGGSWGDDD